MTQDLIDKLDAAIHDRRVQIYKLQRARAVLVDDPRGGRYFKEGANPTIHIVSHIDGKEIAREIIRRTRRS